MEEKWIVITMKNDGKKSTEVFDQKGDAMDYAGYAYSDGIQFWIGTGVLRGKSVILKEDLTPEVADEIVKRNPVSWDELVDKVINGSEYV